MDWQATTERLGGIAVIALAVLAGLFLFLPNLGLTFSGHDPEKLTSVVGGRYAAFALLAALAVWSHDLRAMRNLAAVLTLMGLLDVLIYAGSGAGVVMHVIATVFGAVVTISATIAVRNNGAK